MNDEVIGKVVSGTVTNVANFGAFVLLEERCCTAACCSNGLTRFSDYSDAMISSRRWAFSARCSLFTSVEVSADLLYLRTERHCGRTLLNFLDLLFKLNGRL